MPAGTHQDRGGKNSRNNLRGESLDEFCEREQIKLDVFREKGEITWGWKEREERIEVLPRLL